MTKKNELEDKKLEAIEILRELETLLTERISDAHQVKGMMQCRHAYCYYRDHVWRAVRLLNGENEYL